VTQIPGWTRETGEYPHLAHDLRALDRELDLRFNFLFGRYEVWHPTRGLVLRVLDRTGDYTPPGEWMLDYLRGRRATLPEPLRHGDALRDYAIRQEEAHKRSRERNSPPPSGPYSLTKIGGD